jgi:hypothetical protein
MMTAAENRTAASHQSNAGTIRFNLQSGAAVRITVVSVTKCAMTECAIST